MTETTQDAVLRKLRGLLAQAEDAGATQAERDAFSARAEELMIKYNVDAATVAASGTGAQSEQLKITKFDLSGIYSDALVTGMSHVAEILNVEIVYARFSGTHRRVYAVGFESDLATTGVLLASLHLQALTALREWNRDYQNEWSYQFATGMERFKARREFVLGFFVGAGKRIKETLTRVVDEAAPGTALALRSRFDVVKAHSRSELKTKESKSRRQRGPSWAYSDGYADGQQADIGRGRVDAARQRALGGGKS